MYGKKTGNTLMKGDTRTFARNIVTKIGEKTEKKEVQGQKREKR